MTTSQPRLPTGSRLARYDIVAGFPESWVVSGRAGRRRQKKFEETFAIPKAQGNSIFKPNVVYELTDF